jgi:hypothetical protein
MVYSPKLTFVANGNNPISIGHAMGETICFDSLELTIDCLGCLSLSPHGVDSGAVFIGWCTVGRHICTPSSKIPPMKAAMPRAKEGAPDPLSPEVAMW